MLTDLCFVSVETYFWALGSILRVHQNVLCHHNIICQQLIFGCQSPTIKIPIINPIWKLKFSNVFTADQMRWIERNN